MTKETELLLPSFPPFEEVCWAGVSEFYGAGSIAAKYCGLHQFKPIRGIWKHGWTPQHMVLHPEGVLGNQRLTKKHEYCWVARKDEETFLKGHGYYRARAIGLPVVYLDPVNIPRIPGSLLVMPAHSIDCTEHQWNFREYAQQIQGIRSSFSTVLACIHPSCLKKGYWIKDFAALGIPVIEGVRGNDRNALRRLQMLLSTFEYVTTNGLGSHLAYAAYWGAKVSFFGSYPRTSAEDFRDHPLYNRHPEILASLLGGDDEIVLRQRFPDFFCHPKSARERIDWGREEIGAANKVAPEELRSLFGFGTTNRALWSVRASLPRPVKRMARGILSWLSRT